MEPGRRAELAQIMERLITDEAVVVELYEAFFDDVARVVTYEVRARGGAIEEVGLAGLVFEACDALRAVAAGWRADGGALPWVWARRRINQVVAAALPSPHAALADADDRPAPPLLDGAALAEPELGVVLAGAVRRDPAVRRFVEAAAEVVTLADLELLLRYRMQQQAGDPSPAHTLGAELGLQPPAVRQRTSRTRRKLRRALEADARLAAVAGVSLVAGAA